MRDDEEDWGSVNPMTLFSVEEEKEVLRALQYAYSSGYHKQRSITMVIQMLTNSISERS